MLAKCANPLCTLSFLYLREGKLFKLEPEHNPAEAKKAEYFWLCSRCSKIMTLCLEIDASVKTILFPDLAKRSTDVANLLPIKRQQGLLLNCIHAGPAAAAA